MRYNDIRVAKFRTLDKLCTETSNTSNQYV